MICPNCRSHVADGLSICDNCDFILDASFLGGEGASATGEGATKIKPAPTADDGATRIKPAPAAPPPKGKANAQPETRIVTAASVKPPPAATLYEGEDEATADGRRPASVLEMATAPDSTAEAVDDMIASYRALPPSEKLVVMGAAALLFSLVLPWKSDRVLGDDPGVLTDAWPLLFVATLAVSIVVGRRARVLAKFRDVLLQVNTVLGLGAATGCVAFMRATLDVDRLRAGARIVEQVNSAPAFGSWLGLLSSLVLLAGTVLTWMRRDSLGR